MERARAIQLLRRASPFLEAVLVGVVVWWMLRVRMAPYEAFVSAAQCSPACFIGTDPYYHLRAVLVSVAHFPEVLRWDPWTRFPDGTETGQFGTLFDLLIALAARLTGDPNDVAHVARVVAAAPAWFGALTAVPVYLLGRRLGGRLAAVWSVVVLALLPGEFLIRSLAAYSDHHVAEALFSSLAVLGVLWAADAGRTLGTGAPLWRVLAPSAAGAVGLFLYLWTWPPGVLFVGILGLWVVLQLLLDEATVPRDAGPEATTTARGFAWAMALAFGGAALLTLLLVEQRSFAFNLFSLLQPLSLAAVALVALGLEYGGRELRKRRLPGWIVPVGALAALLVAIPVASAAAPSLYGPLRWGFSWITGIGTTANILTIQEARATCDPTESWPFCDTFSRSYGLTILTAVLALGLLAWEIARRRRPVDLLLFLWLFVMLMAATTQVRFNYYLAVVVALANGWLVGFAARATGLTAALGSLSDDRKELKRGGGRRGRGAAPRAAFAWHQPLAIAAVMVVVWPGLVDPTETTYPASSLAGFFSVDSEVTLWHYGLAWMKENTPSAGMDLRRAYDRPAGGTFEYPPEAYGVLSWWDYGHWIQVLGERPPVANPFQQNAPAMSLYFTSQDEASAEALLTNLMDGDPYRARYVMISDADALGKYGAITIWANQQDKSRPVMYQGATTQKRDLVLGGESVPVTTLGPAYRNAMMSRLYFDNADGLAHYRLVYSYPGVNCVGHLVDADGQPYRGTHFNDQVTTGTTCTGIPDWTREPTSVLNAQGGFFVVEYVDAASLKIFEHVRGANLTGTAPAGTPVTARVTLAAPYGVGQTATFAWNGATTAGPDGTWSLTVPYSTTAYLAPAQGGTNLVVKAAGPYTVTVGATTAEVDVPDEAVLGGETVEVT